MKWKSLFRGRGTAACLVTSIALLAGQTALAQDGGMLQVFEVKVKPGQTQEFEDLQRQYAEAGRAAGQSGRNIWQVVRGESNTYHIVQTVDNYASFDSDADPVMPAADWARWVARITRTIDTRHVWNLRAYPNLVIPVNEDESNDIVMLRIRTVKPGMSDEYEEWLEEKLIPNLREGGQDGASWYRVHTGGNPDTWFGATRHSSWAELDPPGPLEFMGERRRNSMLDEAAEMRSGFSRNLVLVHRPELSY